MKRMLAAVACLLSACAASSKASYGPVARYETDNHAWVARNGEKAWWFRNPLTGCALQCRDDVIRWASLEAKASRTENQRSGAAPTGMAVTFPLSLPAVVLFLPALAVSSGLSPKSATKYRGEGDAALKRNDPKAASDAYLIALRAGDKSAAEPLAQIWEGQGDLEDAKRARGMLLCGGGNLGGDAWSRIESWYRAQGGTLSSCTDPSREPVDIAWEE
jgi:hypothetical protein